MKIDHASYDEVLTVAQNMRARDLDEFLPLSAANNRDELALQLAQQFGGRTDVLCAYNKAGAPVCIGGTIETRPNAMTLLFFATDEFPQIVRPLTRFIRDNLFPRYFDVGVHRIEALALAGNVEIHGWLERLGLKQEAPLRAYGKGREDYLMFALVTEGKC